jgi:uncharacterized protein (DUF433 family)
VVTIPIRRNNDCALVLPTPPRPISGHFHLGKREIPSDLCQERPVNEATLLERITVDPRIFGGKPIIRGHRLAAEHVLGMQADGDSFGDILAAYQWLEPDDILACLSYARRLVAHERIESFAVELET